MCDNACWAVRHWAGKVAPAQVELFGAMARICCTERVELRGRTSLCSVAPSGWPEAIEDKVVTKVSADVRSGKCMLPCDLGLEVPVDASLQ